MIGTVVYVSLTGNSGNLVDVNSGQEYFFYMSGVVGRKPVRGSRVAFRVLTNKTPKPLPYATDILVLTPAEEFTRGINEAMKGAGGQS